MNIARRTLAGLGSAVLVSAVLTVAAPGAAHAAPTVCEPNYTWYTTSTTSTTLYVKSGNGIVYSAPSSASLNVKTDLTKTISFSASYTASIGGNLEIGVPVRGFNLAAGLDTSASAAMDVAISGTWTVTQDITIPPGHSMLQYVGHRITTATVTQKRCNSTGSAVSTGWSGTLKGPRWAATGWIDCKDTTLC
ncbi:hypothetical protein KZZ52_14950 [Dactylosporangium sp. AC04546]|uniref:hypothetical protein n=1 Tax=Dactylosporangium sp. AC04546 TaxID=2862460 RepID=UPI001EE0F5BA|nr:hypothetical protein [Dactylosporangium sp. AC04546]WVK86609.1 hypothetical protein KZZ52_14950 [Dactylosporangium sp. AC04546]